MSDYSVVYFNGIERGFSVPAVLADFTVGGHLITIRFYGLIIAIGYILALVAVTRLARRQRMDLDKFYDMVIWGTILGIIGARLMYVVFTWDYYSQHLGDIWKIHDGGLAIYGGVLFGALGAFLVSLIRKTSILDALDLAGVGFLLGQGVGRWGNFFNQEAFGTNTNLPWGMMSDKIRLYITTHQEFFAQHHVVVSPDRAVHPAFLYESLWCLLGFVLLYFMFKNRRKYRGQVILSYMAWYGLERVLVEGIRTDSLYFGSSAVRVSQVLSAVLAAAAIILLIRNFLKYKDAKPFGPYQYGTEE